MKRQHAQKGDHAQDTEDEGKGHGAALLPLSDGGGEMSIDELVRNTQQELDRYVSSEYPIQVDWIDDEYASAISAAPDEGDMMDDTESRTEYDPGEAGVDIHPLLYSFDCRRPAWTTYWLYYYAGCAGYFARIARSRVWSVVATGYCTVPTRRFKVYHT
jgi:hypothetical protein